MVKSMKEVRNQRNFDEFSDWKKNKRDGFGKLISAKEYIKENRNPFMYEGQFVEDRRNGFVIVL